MSTGWVGDLAGKTSACYLHVLNQPFWREWQDGPHFGIDMNIRFLLPILPPKMPTCEAISQEISALRAHFDGDLVYINPNERSPIYLPRLVFGFHKLKQLRTSEAGLDLYHVYNPDPFPYPILRVLRRPVVYSLTGGVNQRPSVSFFASMATVTVTDKNSLERLKAWGVSNAVLVRPGIDTGRLTCSPLPLRSEIRLMVGSAPWTRAQFRTKGVDALLAAARQLPQLHLTFLWRGVLAEEMDRRVRQMRLEKQVTVLNKQVDVNEVLAGVHASVTLAVASDIVKAYPHSLMESLAAGKPVLVGQAIPMADYVRQTGCGQVVEQVTPAAILAAIESLRREYENLRESARQVGQRDFSLQQMIASYGEVYEQVLEPTNQL